MDDLTYDLFDDADFSPPRRKDRSELVIRGPYKKTLGSAQISFNRLTRRINKLLSDIETRREQLDSILLFWNATIPELLKTLAKKE